MRQVSGEEEIWVEDISKRHVASVTMVTTTIVKARNMIMVLQPDALHFTLPKVLPWLGRSSRHQFPWFGVVNSNMQRHCQYIVHCISVVN